MAELLKLAGADGGRVEFSHHRDKDGNEVDVVLGDRRGGMVGVEVKATATVRPGDFAGLRRLTDAAGNRLAFGAVLYDGERVIPFGERLFAAPLSSLWW